MRTSLRISGVKDADRMRGRPQAEAEYGRTQVCGADAPNGRAQHFKRFCEDRVFLYDERSRIIYATKMMDVVTYILELEPWDQVDACVFKREMK